jgi:hypothetical protein
MKLERGFREVVDECATDTGAFAALIKQVCYSSYMRALYYLNPFRFTMLLGVHARMMFQLSRPEFSSISMRIPRRDRVFLLRSSPNAYCPVNPKNIVAFVTLILRITFAH